jgi:hypothetical protein
MSAAEHQSDANANVDANAAARVDAATDAHEAGARELRADAPAGTTAESMVDAPAKPAGAATPSSRILALVQASERHGGLLGRLAVTQWPVTVGRALDADLPLDDPHLALQHLRIDRSGDGPVSVEVLQTRNGVSLRGRTRREGERFDWPAGEDLHLGRLKLSLRLADEPQAAELPLASFPWRTTGFTLALVFAVLALMFGMTWLETPEGSVLAQRLPALLAGTAGSIAVWSGLWALVTRLFTGRLWFWRHVRIACATLLGAQALETLAHLLAFMFSLESLARFDVQINLLAAAVGVVAHLTVIAPHRRRGMAAIVAGLAVMVMTVLLSTSWLQTRRLSGQLYMSTLFPPSWRVARAVPLPQFLDEAGALRGRLDKRLKERQDEDDAPASEDSDE